MGIAACGCSAVIAEMTAAILQLRRSTPVVDSQLGDRRSAIVPRRVGLVSRQTPAGARGEVPLSSSGLGQE
jgi:hypothetical protein